jgi:hypothetical protein
MDIARLMADRQRLDAVHRETTTGAYGLAAGNPLRDRLAERGREIEQRTAEIDAEIARRTEALTELGRTWGEFVYRRDRAGREARANQRAERALSHIEGALDSATEHGDRPDEAADLADRSAAVLAAYRELLGSG